MSKTSKNNSSPTRKQYASCRWAGTQWTRQCPRTSWSKHGRPKYGRPKPWAATKTWVAKTWAATKEISKVDTNDANGGGGMPQNMMQSGDGSPPDASAGQDVLPSTRILLLLNSHRGRNLIEITLTIKGAASYDLESSSPKRVGRVAPKVVHAVNPPKKPYHPSPKQPQSCVANHLCRCWCRWSHQR